MREGDLFVNVDFADRNDEIGDLGRHFNEMVQQLRESREEIRAPAPYPDVPRRASGDTGRDGGGIGA